MALLGALVVTAAVEMAAQQVGITLVHLERQIQVEEEGLGSMCRPQPQAAQAAPAS